MTKDYRGETGVIGKQKGYEVFVLTKDQYMDLTNKGEYTVYVISDDGKGRSDDGNWHCDKENISQFLKWRFRKRLLCASGE